MGRRLSVALVVVVLSLLASAEFIYDGNTGTVYQSGILNMTGGNITNTCVTLTSGEVLCGFSDLQFLNDTALAELINSSLSTRIDLGTANKTELENTVNTKYNQSGGDVNGNVTPQIGDYFYLGIFSRWWNGLFVHNINTTEITIGGNTIDTNEWATLDGFDVKYTLLLNNDTMLNDKIDLVNSTLSGRLDTHEKNITDIHTAAGNNYTALLGIQAANAGNETLILLINTSLNSLKYDKSGGTISGDVLVLGNFSVVGSYSNLNVTIVNVNGSISPDVDAVFDLGSVTKRWLGVYARCINFTDGTILCTAYNVDQNLTWLNNNMSATQLAALGNSSLLDATALALGGNSTLGNKNAVDILANNQSIYARQAADNTTLGSLIGKNTNDILANNNSIYAWAMPKTSDNNLNTTGNITATCFINPYNTSIGICSKGNDTYIGYIVGL